MADPARRHRRPVNPKVAARRRFVVRVALFGLVAVALLFVFVFPTQSLLAQWREADEIRSELELLRDEGDRLEREARLLEDDAEIERLARERYNLVWPGETPYNAVPDPNAPAAPSPSPAPPTTTTP